MFSKQCLLKTLRTTQTDSKRSRKELEKKASEIRIPNLNKMNHLILLKSLLRILFLYSSCHCLAANCERAYLLKLLESTPKFHSKIFFWDECCETVLHFLLAECYRVAIARFFGNSKLKLSDLSQVSCE